MEPAEGRHLPPHRSRQQHGPFPGFEKETLHSPRGRGGADNLGLRAALEPVTLMAGCWTTLEVRHVGKGTQNRLHGGEC